MHRMWPWLVSFDSGKCLRTASVVRLGHVASFLPLMASSQVSLVETPANAWRYRILFSVEVNLQTLAIASLLEFLSKMNSDFGDGTFGWSGTHH